MGSSKRTYEAPDIGAMLQRQLRAMVKRAKEGDQEVLSVLAVVAIDVDLAIQDSAIALHDERGHSWDFIAKELGVTRQAAHKRFAQ